MTLFYYDPHFRRHETGGHPECPARIEQVIGRLERSGLAAACTRPEWRPASDERLLRLHDADYLEAVRALAARGGGRAEVDTVVSPMSVDVAALAAGAACDAVERVVRGEARRAFCAVRPPGHHALREGAMGFCLLGNVAIAASVAVEELGLDRVLVVDWDVHHGNGTQAAFWTDPRVGFLSIHRWPFYPGTGGEDETGSGDGLGSTRNLPVEMGVSRDRCLSWFARELEDFADRLRPQLVLVSAGFDAHRTDPIGSLGWETEDFAALTQSVLDVAAAHAGGRLVSVLEGGYNPPVLADCVALHLSELLERDADEARDADG
ncbi:histone deacetylase [Botrimarina sp.]|uniref:histone deacetylase family protein n=1 Tax=Botrimarina sp. TaxID=2795802 RepID=UPI0032F07051